MKNILFTYICPDCEVEIEASYFPSRPAPPCSNPSSPAFSDSGDPEEVEISETCPGCGAVLDIDEVAEVGREAYMDAVEDYDESDDFDPKDIDKE